MGYKLLSKQRKSPYCVLDYMDGFEDDYKLFKGHSVAGEWPKSVKLAMDDDFKKQIKLSDFLENQQFLVIASKELRTFLEKEKVKRVEYLPVTILNHKNRVASKDYSIVNPVGTQDCIDIDKSGISWNDIIPEDIDSADHLVLDEDKIAKDAVFFRAKGLVDATFVRDDLAQKILAEKFTGVAFLDVGDYEG